jgi:uncharacterized protein YjdB
MLLPIPAPNKINISNAKININIGDISELSINTNERVLWSSSNQKIAKVNGIGEVEALREGHVIITAECYGRKYKCDVIVSNK